MKERIKQFLIYLLKVLVGYDVAAELTLARVPPLPPPLASNLFVVPEEVSSLLPLAKSYYDELANLSTSGEWKRHQVLAKLLRSGATEGNAGIAIELVHRGHEGK